MPEREVHNGGTPSAAMIRSEVLSRPPICQTSPTQNQAQDDLARKLLGWLEVCFGLLGSAVSAGGVMSPDELKEAQRVMHEWNARNGSLIRLNL